MSAAPRPPRWMLVAAAALLLGVAWLWWEVGGAVLFGQLNGLLC